jgi:hypothetical protein
MKIDIILTGRGREATRITVEPNAIRQGLANALAGWSLAPGDTIKVRRVSARTRAPKRESEPKSYNAGLKLVQKQLAAAKSDGRGNRAQQSDATFERLRLVAQHFAKWRPSHPDRELALIFPTWATTTSDMRKSRRSDYNTLRVVAMASMDQVQDAMPHTATTADLWRELRLIKNG